MLGWRILKDGEYILPLPQLSADEEELILAAQEAFNEVARSRSVKSREEGVALIKDIMVQSAEKNRIYLDSGQTEYLAKIALMHIYGFAFLDPLLEDDEIEEISIIGPNRPAYVYIRKHGWKKVNAAFDDEAGITDAINKMARNIGRHITMQNPRLDAMLPNGSRLHASLPPVSEGEITIRKFRNKSFSPKELADMKLLSIDALAALSMLMQSDSSVIIGGNTASGKTTTLNSLFAFVPWNERVLIAEETPEISIPHEHQLRLVANKEMNITLKDLVYDSLRMRPDRMIVGEVRSRQEVEALFDVLMAGQARGTYATVHAQSVTEALSRIESFGLRKNDIASIDCIIIQRRMLQYDPVKRKNCEIRRITEIAEIDEFGNVRTAYKNGKMDDDAFIDRLADKFGLGKSDVAAELRKRRKIILRANADYGEFYQIVQSAFYNLEETI